MKNYKAYANECYSAAEIANGEDVPVGGASFGHLDRAVVADFGSFEPMFDRMKEAYERGATPERMAHCRDWLKSVGSDADPGLFMAMSVFQKTLEKEHPEISGQRDLRQGFYRAAAPAPALSAVVAGKGAECAEIALLAHAALRHMGFPNTFVCGGAVWDRDSEYSQKHSFIMAGEPGGRTAIFDPANPVRSGEEVLPAVYFADAAQVAAFEERARRGDSLMAVRNTLTGEESFFGASDGASVYLDKCAVHLGGKLPRSSSFGSPPSRPG
jgi:hypothetical protein